MTSIVSGDFEDNFCGWTLYASLKCRNEIKDIAIPFQSVHKAKSRCMPINPSAGRRRLFGRVRIRRRPKVHPGYDVSHPSRTVMKAVVRTSALLTRNHWRSFAITSARRTDASGPAACAATTAGMVNPTSPPKLKEGWLYIDTIFPIRIGTWE